MTNESPEQQPYLWRLMIDQEHQGKDHGHQAVSILCRRLAQLGAIELYTSCAPGPEGPLVFYERLGFEATGDKDEDGEVILKLLLDVP
jgi:diamine N-acetyltransferase